MRSCAVEGGGLEREDAPIARASFDSDDYPEADRSNAYQTIVAGTACLTPLAQPFYARFKTFVVGPLRFHYVEAVPHHFERSILKIAMDRADYIVVQHMIVGEVEGDCDGRRVSANSGSVYCLDFRRPSVLTEKRRTRLQYLSIDRQAALGRFGDLEPLHGAVFNAERAASYTRFLAETYPTLEGLRESETVALAAQTFAELGRLFSDILPLSSASILERAQAYILAQLGSRRLTPESVANALGVSRSKLYVPFNELGGVSKYIWDQRLHHVHVALTTAGDGRSLTELAHDLGFGSQAHLSSLYRKAYGEAPSRVRQKRQTA